MADLQISEMSLAELKKLKTQIDRAIDGFDARKKSEAAEAVSELARSLGFSLEQLTSFAPSKGSAKDRAPVSPKYEHPDDPSVTWSGRGRRPAWFVTALESGASEESLLIKAKA